MLFIDNKGITDPRINLAIEEYALNNLNVEEGLLLFYINQPSIIIGRNQNTVEEINTDYVEKNNIIVVRRLSGGGAVYHDLGNLNFSFLTKDEGDNFQNFKKFTQPVVDALNKMGVHAELSGRNDILAEGKKFSGNAMFSTNGRMFSHGTIMFDADINEVVNALRPKKEKMESKGIKSVRSRVTNIIELLEDKTITVEDFRLAILHSIFDGEENIKYYDLTEEDWAAIHKISEERYQKWEWNYGKSPKFNMQRTKKFASGFIDLRIEVRKGMIEDIHIFGDFFGVGDMVDVEAVLKGIRYDASAIHEALQTIDIAKYFGGVTEEEFVQLMY
ncbi:MAG: lipoate--protein ligase [Kurthia sp.]|nr:lipoate--protein ligase [Candidatus Kurthia equi]